MPIGSVQELDEAIDAHGADMARWPAELRDGAAALLANSGEARRHLEAALKLEKDLRAGSGTKASPQLVDRIMRAAFQKRPPGSRS